MRVTVIVTATLLASAFGAQAASRNAPHPTHRRATAYSACIARQRPTQCMPVSIYVD